LRLGLADWLARTNQLSNLEQAVVMVPGNARFQARLAALEDQLGRNPGAAWRALETAVALNPGYAAGWIELGLRAEAREDQAKAEACLLEAARVDRTFYPRWTLANYYFRRRDFGKFWRWARQAAEVTDGDATPLFRLCWQVTPDPATILERAVPARVTILGPYFRFLLAEGHLAGAEPVAQRLIEIGDQRQAGAVLDYCDRLLERGQAGPALRAWNGLARRRLIESEPLAPEQGVSLSNAAFLRDPLGQGFDWRIPLTEGVSVARGEQPGMVRVAFAGKQPADCECLWQWLPVEPGRQYRLRFDHRTVHVAGSSGLRWRVEEAGSGTELAPGSPELGAETWTPAEAGFETQPGGRLVRLVLRYRRVQGTARIEGALWVRGLRLEMER